MNGRDERVASAEYREQQAPIEDEVCYWMTQKEVRFVRIVLLLEIGRERISHLTRER
jgi:predicted XRE-type DNA-binding protein